MSVLLPALNNWLRLTERPFLERAEDIPAVRKGFEQKARFFFHAPPGSVFTNTVLGGRDAVSVRSTRVSKEAPVIFYLHGGAYLFGSPATHRAMLARLCAEGQFFALLPSYRLAPEHLFPAALDDALAAYQAVRADHARVVIGGDSAGGGLALSLLAEIERLGLEPPIGAFAFSPLTDMTGSAPSLKENADADVILPATRMEEMAKMYLGEADPADPRASPLFADFTGSPPVWLTVGDSEILLDDSSRMAKRLNQQGVTAELRVEHDLPHVWPLFQTYLPEARETLRILAAWISSLEARSGDS